MEANEKLSEQEIRDRILALEQKIDEELLLPQKTNMALVDDYIREIRELDGSPEKTEEELEAGLRDIYRKAEQRKKKQSFWRFNPAKRCVAAILITVVMLSAFSLIVYAISGPIEKIILCPNEHVEIYFDLSNVPGAPSTLETVYTLGYLPEGYELEHKSVWDEQSWWVWQNEEGHPIEFAQNCLDGEAVLNMKNVEFGLIDVDGIRVFYRKYNGAISYLWITDEYFFQLATRDISLEEGAKIIRSITEYKE